MKNVTMFVVALLWLCLTGKSQAQVPGIINFQGRISVGGTNFDGTGLFKFAFVSDDGGITYWSNDGTAIEGEEPDSAVPLQVTKGLYSVLLGDTEYLNMTDIPAEVFRNVDVRLRVWFDDGVNGSLRLDPDQRIAAVGYAFMAANCAGPVADSQLSPNIARLDSPQTFSGSVSFTGPANNFVGSFNGNGAALTNIPATGLASNTLGSVIVTNGGVYGNLTAGIASNAVGYLTGSQASNSFAFAGDYLTNGCTAEIDLYNTLTVNHVNDSSQAIRLMGIEPASGEVLPLVLMSTTTNGSGADSPVFWRVWNGVTNEFHQGWDVSRSNLFVWAAARKWDGSRWIVADRGCIFTSGSLEGAMSFGNSLSENQQTAAYLFQNPHHGVPPAMPPLPTMIVRAGEQSALQLEGTAGPWGVSNHTSLAIGRLEIVADPNRTEPLDSFEEYVVRTTVMNSAGDLTTNVYLAVSNGTLFANHLVADGSGLTNLNAAKISSGTVTDARLSTNVALRSGGNTFVGNQVFSSGKIGIGLTNATYYLQLSTNSAAKPGGGSWANSSDARLKKDIRPLTGALEALTQLRGVSFEWINPADHANEMGPQGGFVAQEVERAFPNWVCEVPGAEHDQALTPDGRVKSLTLPFEFDALVVESIKELKAQNESLRLRNAALEQRLEALEQRLEAGGH
jgi:hypothetical protein